MNAVGYTAVPYTYHQMLCLFHEFSEQAYKKQSLLQRHDHLFGFVTMQFTIIFILPHIVFQALLKSIFVKY